MGNLMGLYKNQQQLKVYVGFKQTGKDCHKMECGN